MPATIVVDGVTYSQDMRLLISFPANRQGHFTFPDQVREIGYRAFHNCTGLTSVLLPAGMRKPSEWYFNECTGLTHIDIAPGGMFESRDGIVYRKKDQVLVACPPGKSGSLALPEGVTAIGRAALAHCTQLTEVLLPDSVTEIQEGAFAYCTSLVRIRLSSGLKIIQTAAFQNCTQLNGIEFPQGMTIISTFAFEGCHELKEVRIPESVTRLGWEAFSGGTFVRCNLNQFRMLSRATRMHAVRCLLRDPDALPEKYRHTVENCVRTYRDELRDAIILDDDVLALEGYYAIQRKPTLQELSEAVEHAASLEKVNILSALMKLQNRLYPPETQEFHRQLEQDKSLDPSLRTVSDWRRIFRYRIKDGGITVTGYKSSDPVVIIPAQIGTVPVLAVDLNRLVQNARGITDIFIPEGVRQLVWVSRWMYYHSDQLPDRIHIPASVQDIIWEDSSNWPRSLGKQLVIHAPMESYAAACAREHGIPLMEVETE